ncbi:helix-turn-helix transcriptional regulator [Bacillus sp. FJAT-49736]|uniref:helix-turn-helix domain-containing protein n=1 Tax=Bacillus sp. FJAT-49736 TaxID=2833582 RepID=UPI001BCA3959|nr:helix-turn-helix transcriptional regulator [Bacillus sp. FJAT-49736]MBS4173361.1 helix-turn-helix transcriptional regulator [Bacillus sp. FJAT-49736]
MIGDRIKALRISKGYSITKLAELAGVSKSYLSYIERDMRNNPSLEFLCKIAKPLNTNIEFLLNAESSTEHNEYIDEEWRTLLSQAIEKGLNKDDFQALQEFIQFRNWVSRREV